MSIFPLPLLLVVSSCLLCPVASLPGQKVKEVQTLPGQAGRHCTSAHLLTSAADCLAAAKALGLGGSVYTLSSSGAPPGCIWTNYLHPGQLAFNTYKASTKACGDPTFNNPLCICVDPCPIGNYQNEESSKTCKACLPGTYNDETGRSSCQNCTIGKYNNEIGESTCRNCPAGKNSARGASNCQPNCCHAKANYPTYEKDCNTITDAAACSGRLHHLRYTCDWNCDVTTVMNVHNESQKYLRD